MFRHMRYEVVRLQSRQELTVMQVWMDKLQPRPLDSPDHLSRTLWVRPHGHIRATSDI